MKFHKDYSFDMTLSSSWIPRCPRLGFGRENGATPSGASADAEMGLLPEAAGQNPGRSGCSHAGKWAQRRAQRMQAEEAVSPRQGQECLQEKKGVIPPGTLVRAEEQTPRAEATRPETQGSEQESC